MKKNHYNSWNYVYLVLLLFQGCFVYGQDVAARTPEKATTQPIVQKPAEKTLLKQRSLRIALSELEKKAQGLFQF